ncbi:hypothetical protein [Neorhizobium sp. T25_13]|uniref:hypothetical protein n=1 Tax=Neorhizobium sp. T25_13 TaxID=2093830 RepID=UPI00155E4DAF|nr:hypothetical protein [Neorhizobium sp. T25_13]
MSKDMVPFLTNPRPSEEAIFAIRSFWAAATNCCCMMSITSIDAMMLAIERTCKGAG